MRRTFLCALVVTLALPLLADTEPNPSNAQRASIEKLFVLLKMDDMVRTTVDAMYAQMEKQILENAAANGSSAEEIADAKELFSAFRARAAKINLDGDLRDGFLRLYAKYFTDEEIDQLVVFYESAVGRKTLELMPQMMQEGMQLGAEHLGPKIEHAFAEAQEEFEKKRPWQRTMRDLRSVATAIEAYAIDNESYPSGDYASLRGLLVPTYLNTFPEKDIWGHEYAYVASDDGQRYRLVSAGADTIFDWDSRRIAPVKEGEELTTTYRDRLEDDVIFADGEFVQLPVQARPKGE